ncbi:MAG: hypothetical protein P1R58_13410, partial [bacterium]|nr:hypothetical protein [bacterium]
MMKYTSKTSPANRIQASLIIALIAMLIAVAVPLRASVSQPDMANLEEQFSPKPADWAVKQFENLRVIPSSNGPGELTRYAVEFDLAVSAFVRLKEGGLAFSFPSGFSLAEIAAISISDDHDNFEHLIKSFRVSQQTLYVDLRCPTCDEFDEKEGNLSPLQLSIHVTIGIESIGNPGFPGEYLIAAVGYDWKRRLIAGPDLSETFAIYSGSQAQLLIHPSEDLILQAGQSVQFSTELSDGSGNPPVTVGASYAFVDGSDDIGLLVDSVLYAMRPGQAQVRATFDTLTAISGVITVMEEGPNLTYVANSFSPTSIFTNTETHFYFQIELQPDYPGLLQFDSGEITLTGSGFSSTVHLSFPTGEIVPGINFFATEDLLVPASQSGQELTVAATIMYTTAAGNPVMSFATDFQGQLIRVGNQPDIEIAELTAVAPNTPWVNTNQEFQMRAVVVNQSLVPIDSLKLRLVSNGLSTFSPGLVSVAIGAGETDTVLFNVRASAVPSVGEQFTIEPVHPSTITLSG